MSYHYCVIFIDTIHEQYKNKGNIMTRNFNEIKEYL